MTKTVLVLTNKQDIHCDFVIREISHFGVEVIRVNTEDLFSNSDFSVNITQKSSCSSNIQFHLIDSERDIKINNLFSVWYRKPEPVCIPNTGKDKSITDYIQNEYKHFLNSFYSLIGNKKWVNDPLANRKASQKLNNLALANNIGLNTPNTIVTNNPQKALKFAEENNWEIITKPFATSAFKVSDCDFWFPYANKVTKENIINNMNNISLSPTILQQYIEKKQEIRVTVVGERIFACLIESQEFDRSKYDFRAINPYKLRHTIIDLPLDICNKLIIFNRIFNLQFSTFDIIQNNDDDYYFLECNPNGQWYWIEDITGVPISKAMAELLINI